MNLPTFQRNIVDLVDKDLSRSGRANFKISMTKLRRLFSKKDRLHRELLKAGHSSSNDCEQVCCPSLAARHSRIKAFPVFLVDAVIDYSCQGPLEHSTGGRDGNLTRTKKMEAPTDDKRQHFCSPRFQTVERSVRREARFLSRLPSGTPFQKGTRFTTRARTSGSASAALIQIQADKREGHRRFCYSGDIAAIVGIKNITTGDTTPATRTIRSFWSRPSFSRSGPSPWRLSRRRNKIRKKWRSRLQRLSEEDPNLLGFTPHEDTGQTIIAGMGELHLENHSRSHVSASSKWRRMPASRRSLTRETITGKRPWRRQADQNNPGRSRSVRTCGSGCAAGPNAARDLSSRTKSSAASFRENTSRRLRKGSRKRPQRAVLGGYPVDRPVEVDIVLWQLAREVDSKRTRVSRLAAIFAMKDGFKQGKPIPARNRS